MRKNGGKLPGERNRIRRLESRAKGGGGKKRGNFRPTEAPTNARGR